MPKKSNNTHRTTGVAAKPQSVPPVGSIVYHRWLESGAYAIYLGRIFSDSDPPRDEFFYLSVQTGLDGEPLKRLRAYWAEVTDRALGRDEIRVL